MNFNLQIWFYPQYKFERAGDKITFSDSEDKALCLEALAGMQQAQKKGYIPNKNILAILNEVGKDYKYSKFNIRNSPCILFVDKTSDTTATILTVLNPNFDRNQVEYSLKFLSELEKKDEKTYIHSGKGVKLNLGAEMYPKNIKKNNSQTDNTPTTKDPNTGTDTTTSTGGNVIPLFDVNIPLLDDIMKGLEDLFKRLFGDIYPYAWLAVATYTGYRATTTNNRPTQVGFGMVSALSAYRFYQYQAEKKKDTLFAPLRPLILRVDKNGDGHFGSPRNSTGTGKAHRHEGTDFLAKVGQTVFSPITGKITFIGYPYKNDTTYQFVRVENDRYKVDLHYCRTPFRIGTTIEQGTTIGKAQDIASKYKNSIDNHIHIEIKDKEGKLLNPEHYFIFQDTKVQGIGALKKYKFLPIYQKGKEPLRWAGIPGKTNFVFANKKTGVYIIKEDNKIVYVGVSIGNLGHTAMNHFREWTCKSQYSGRCLTYVNKMDKHNYTMRVIICDEARAKKLELGLIAKYQPRDNLIKPKTFKNGKVKNVVLEYSNADFSDVPF